MNKYPVDFREVSDTVFERLLDRSSNCRARTDETNREIIFICGSASIVTPYFDIGLVVNDDDVIFEDMQTKDTYAVPREEVLLVLEALARA